MDSGKWWCVVMWTKTISISKEFEEEYKHLCNQHNASRYVLELVRKDMKKAIEDKSIIDTVRSILEGNSNSTALNKNNNINNVNNNRPIINNETIKLNASAFIKK